MLAFGRVRQKDLVSSKPAEWQWDQIKGTTKAPPAWRWCTPLVPAGGGRGRWISELEASLAYRMSSRTARATQRIPVLVLRTCSGGHPAVLSTVCRILGIWICGEVAYSWHWDYFIINYSTCEYTHLTHRVPLLNLAFSLAYPLSDFLMAFSYIVNFGWFTLPSLAPSHRTSIPVFKLENFQPHSPPFYIVSHALRKLFKWTPF